MRCHRTGRAFGTSRLAAGVVVAVALIAVPAVANAQFRQTQTTTATDSQSHTDFLFGRPHGWIGVGGSWVLPRADSDLFAFVSDQLTIERSDFHAAAFTTGFGIPVAPKLDIVGDVEVSRNGIGSEYRNFVKADRTPILQTTILNQYTVGVGARYMPFGRGREISRYAFLPRRVTPYAGAGASIVNYSFLQQGQFVDFVDLSIFSHTFRSKGWAVGPHVDAGADVQLWRALFLNVTGRYTWVHSTLGPDFVGFDSLDLAGFRGSTGVTVAF